jgi:DNA adenine methylase
MIRPIVKMPGGKSRLLPELLKRVPAEIGTYSEPFVGGGALFFALASEEPRRFKCAVLGDKNQELMLFYAVVKMRVEELIGEMRFFRHGRRQYEDRREDFNRRGCITNPVERAATFLFLNKTCFNGLWRVNKSGAFNVPWGKYKNPLICDPDALRAASKALRGVKLITGDFSLATLDLKKGDFVYADSPYAPLSESADFTAYTPGGFGLDDQARLAGVARRLHARGVNVLVSNSDTPTVHTLYPTKRFRRERVYARRSINSDITARGAIAELLIRPR